ncbi:MAG: hypothetical protein IPM54_38145 [Polyangiaceae bacterium]|nr:hypothetical protein [Polyangiaceae bacterium]
MRRERMLGFSAVFALSLLVLHGVASAQADLAQPAPSPVDLGLQQKVSLSPAEQASEAQEALARMDSQRGTVRRMLEEARAQRDVVKTLCLDDKLNQIDVALRNARDRKSAIDGAVQRNDADLASHEFTVLGVLRQRAEQLVAEANLCIGKEAEILGEAAVIASVDPAIADEPAYYPPNIIIIEPPPTGSVIK